MKVDQSTISRLLEKIDEYTEGVVPNNAYNRREGTTVFPEIEETVARWFFKHQHNVNMSGELIKKKAELVRHDQGISSVDFRATSGWLDGFKKRRGIRDCQRHGESARVDMNLIEYERPKIKAILDKFDLRDIYNMDEAGLFFQREVSVY